MDFFLESTIWPAILLKNQQYCQQYCWIINNIASNIASNIVSNIAETAILLTILPAILLIFQQYCWQYCWSAILLAILLTTLSAILLIQQYCWQYCQQYCWLFSNIAGNIASNIASNIEPGPTSKPFIDKRGLLFVVVIRQPSSPALWSFQMTLRVHIFFFNRSGFALFQLISAIYNNLFIEIFQPKL